MGQTLENGVYLPSEGERNCYAGLKTNWEILDQKVADVTALQQAVAGALHREIVESLPTTDIDPNTIYMILSGTSATENVYDEYMYVNNAWELIGTSATDLTNYYTKAEVDGKLLLKANASDLTSHTGDTTIHVTTADKNKWNNQTYVFRYSSTALTASSTNSNALLDNTDNLKVGDKVIDSNGVLFSITAIDTANSTFTIGTALIDLATDSDVVHKSGSETVDGFKQFANIRVTNSIKGINLDSTTTDLNNCYYDFAPYGEGKGGNIQYYYCNTDAGTANISNLPESKAFFLTSITTRLISNSLYVKQILINSNSKTFVRYCNNSTWSSWVNETDSEYVHKSGDETISGDKTFANSKVIVGRNTDVGSAIQFINSDVVGDSANGSSGFEVYGSSISDANKIGSITIGEFSNNGGSYATIECNRTVSGVKSSNVIRSLIRTNGLKELSATVDNDCRLGTEFLRWSKIYGTEYYYGSNNVEFSTKFVTTDTAQTISGNKTFSDNLTIYNSDNTVTPKGLTIRNAQWGMGESGATTVSSINFLDKNSSIPASVMASKGISGQSFLRFSVRTKDSQNTTYLEEIYYDIDTSGNVEFRSWHDNAISLGSSLYKWKDVQTYKVNNLEPSSLSLPATTGTIDISSYITDLTGVNVNTYTSPANGYIVITCNSTDVDYIKMSNNLNFVSVIDNTNNQFTSGILGVWQPCVAGVAIQIRIKASALNSARFIPCQGNV